MEPFYCTQSLHEASQTVGSSPSNRQPSFSIAQLSFQNDVADSSQRVCATVTFRSRERCGFALTPYSWCRVVFERPTQRTPDRRASVGPSTRCANLRKAQWVVLSSSNWREPSASANFLLIDQNGPASSGLPYRQKTILPYGKGRARQTDHDFFLFCPV